MPMPYLDLSRQLNIPYETVVCLADGIEAGLRGDEPRVWYEMAWCDLRSRKGDTDSTAIFHIITGMVYDTKALFGR